MDKLVAAGCLLVIVVIMGIALYTTVSPFLWLRDTAANTRRIVELLEAERSSDVRMLANKDEDTERSGK